MILGIDTATARASVAVAAGGRLVHEEDRGPGDDGRPRHSEELLPAIEACVQAAGGWEPIKLIAVGTGPGSYTGLRIGIATARALSQGRGLPIAGVGTLEALARGIAADARAEGRPALPVIDARRGEAFAALHGPGGEPLGEPFVGSSAELSAAAEALDPSPLAAGDGAVRFRRQLEAAGAVVPPAEDAVHLVAARHICALAGRAEASKPERIEPIYLREPDAKRWIDRDAGR